MYEIKVEGMTCNHCVSKVTRSIKAVDTEAGVEVDLKIRMVRVRTTISIDELMDALDDAGYPGTKSQTA